MGDNKSFAGILGTLVGKAVIICLAAVITSTIAAVSIKIIKAILTWLF